MAGEEPRSPPGALRGVEPRSPPAAREPRSPPGIGRKRSNSAPIPEKWNLCVLCGQDKKACNGTLGALLGPLDDGNRNGVGVYIHRYCALWSSEVYHNSDATTLRNVGKAIRRGRQIRCGHCGERGATLGCRNERCNVSYHLHCARAVGCAFNISRYLIACPRHAKDYKHEEEEARRGLPGLPESVRRRALGLPGPGPARDRDRGHGAHRDHGAGPAPRWAPDSPPARRLGLDGPGGGSGGASPARREEGGMESPAAKRRKLDPGAVAKHLLLARAALDSARAEAAAAAAAAAAAEADDDEAVFAAKERRRTAKDTARLAPVMLGGGAAAAAPAAVAAGAAAGAAGAGGAGGGAAAPTAPGGVYSRGFESVGGAQEAVAALREMVLLPLLHPGLMERLGVEGAAPPRGILLHGLPGTGKTLAVRALAGEVGRRSPVPVALFARGGADVLGKYHGDAERTLRLLFEEARRRAPSIIFLDELDALAPSRSQAGTGGCDQIYASVVATLLALMDGMADRGQVVVIGATNRPDNLDPALRRPGRFDREVAFGLPGPADREAILRVHTRAWSPPPPPQLLRALAAQTEGFAGADLEALSASAVLAAVRRSLRGGAPGPGASLGAPPSALRPSGSGGAGAGAGVGASGVAEIAGGGSSGGACPSLEELVQRRLRAKAEAEQRRRQRAEDRERRAQQRRLRRQLKAAAAEAAAKVEAERLKEAAAAEAAAARAAAKEAAAEAVAKAAEAKAAAKAAARAEREAEAREAEAREANADAEMEDVGAEPGGETGAQEAAATTAGAEEAEAGGPEHIAPTAGPSAIRQGVDTSPTPAHSPNTAPDEVAGPGPGPGPQVTPRPADGAGGMLHDGSGGDDGSGGVGGAAAGPSGEAARPARAGFASVFRGFGAMFDLAADSPALRQPRAAARQEQPQQEQRQQEEPAPERQPAPGQEPPRDADQELDLGRDPGRAVEAGEEEGPGPQAMEVEAVPAAGVAAELGPGSVGPDAGAEAAIVPGPHASGRTGDAGAGAAAAAARPGVPAEPAAPAEGQGAASAETTAPAEGQGAERGGDEDRAQARDAPAEAEAEASSDEDDEEGEDEGREEEADAHLDDWLSGVHVTALDWDAALAAAPKPCSRREAMAAVCPGLPPPPPAHVAALTAPSAAAAVRCLAAAGLAVPPVVADAAAAMAADPTPVPTTGMAAAAGAAALQEATAAALGRLVSALAEFGAVEPVNSASASSSNSPDDLAPAAGNGAGPVATDPVAVPWVLAAGASRLVAPAPAPPVHLLLCGAGDAGQDATASTVLRLLNSSPSPSHPLPKPHSGAANAAPFCQPCPARPVSLHTINIAAIILRGGAAGGGGGLGSGGGASDAAEGVAALVSEALAAAPRGALLVLHLPRIDTWALEQRLGSGRAARLLGGRATAGSQPSSGAAAHGGAGGGSERGRGQVKAGEAGEDEYWDLGSPLAPGWSGGVGGGGGGGRGFDALLEAGAPSSPAHDGSSGSGEGSESEGEGGGGGGSSSDGEDEDDDGDWGGGSDLPSNTGITPAWSLFAQQATAVAAALAGAGGGGTGGRLVVVATCAQPLASLPAEVREFFGAPPTPSAAPSAAQPTSAEAEGDEGEESDGAVPAAALALYRSLMGSGPEAGGPAAVATAATAAVAPREPAAAPPGTSCRHALELAPPSAVALAAAAAAAEAGLLPLLRTAVAEAAITVLLSAATAAGCNGALGPSADAAEPAAPPGGQPPPPLPPPPAGPASRAEEDAEAAGRVGVNAAELERGRKMLLQAQHVIRSLGATMLRRKTGCLLARATVRGGARADGAGGGGEGTPGGGGGSAKDKDKRRRDGVVTLAAVAQRAVEGRIHTLDELMREVASTAALIRSIRSSAATAAASPPPSLPAAANAAASAADLAPSSSRGGVGYSRAAAAASHWEDYVAATLEAASRALGLQDPGNRRLMAAALEAYRGKGAGSGRSAGAGGGGAVGAGGAGAGGGAAGGGERLGTGSPARRTPVRAATRRLLAGSGAGAVTPAAAGGERPAEPHGTGSELASGGGGGSTGVGGAAPPAEQHRLALEVGTGGGGTRVGGGGGEQRLGGGAVLSRAVLQAAAEALAEGVVARLEATGAVRRALDCSWFSAGAGRRGPGVEEVAERVGALGRRLVEACGEAAEQAMGAAATGVGGGGSDGGGGGQQSALWGWALQVVETARGQGGEEGEAMAGAGGSGGALAQAEGGQAAEVAGAVECLASCLEGALGLPSRGAAGA